MVKKQFVIVTLLIFILSLTAIAETSPTLDTTQHDCIYYFTSSDCEECKPADSYFNQLAIKYPNLRVEQLEVYHNSENKQKLDDFYAALEIPEEQQNIPAVFTQSTYLVGVEPIKTVLDGQIGENSNVECPTPNPALVGLTGEPTAPSNPLKTLNFWNVTGSALQNSFQAAMIAILLIMLVLLLAIKDDETLVKRGALFIGIVFIMHFLALLGLFSGFGGKGPFFFYKIVGVIVIIVSIIRIRGFLKTWQLFLKTVPENIKEYGRKTVAWFISPWGIVATAFVTSLFTITPSTKMSVLLQNLLHAGGYTAVVFPYILYYSFIILLPKIALVVILYVTKNELEEKAEEHKIEHKIKTWKDHYHKLVSVTASSVMVVIGLILLFV